MKILFTILEILDYGGITADLELKCRGLKEAGHEVKVVILRRAKAPHSIRKTLIEGGPAGTYPSSFGTYKGRQIMANTEKGWYWLPVLGYDSDEGMANWKRIANKFDMIFHEIPGPNPDPAGRWLELYDVKPPQIMIAHDAHFREMYPHMIDVAPKLKGIACTTPAGYIGLEWMPTYRAFIGAPHPVLDWDSMPRWNQRKPVGVAAHMWKAWKHQDMVVQAAPHLTKSKVIMTGDGIERRYMMSKDKCPKEFKGVWKRGLDSGNMAYKGLLTPDRLFSIYQRSRVMVDMSWSDKFNGLGNHFNRSIIEGYNNGVVPICVGMNMKDDNTQRRLFKGGVTHVEVPHTITPKELAEVIDETCHMHRDDAMEMVTRGRKMLMKYFAYSTTATQFIDLGRQKPCGVYPKLELGKANLIIAEARDMKLANKPTATIKAMIVKKLREREERIAKKNGVKAPPKKKVMRGYNPLTAKKAAAKAKAKAQR